MNLLNLIPARGGSKGIPRKNIKPLASRPLIGWTIDATRQVKGVKRSNLMPPERSPDLDSPQDRRWVEHLIAQDQPNSSHADESPRHRRRWLHRLPLN
jgi:CMP-N-acetylneuraminic acid synthetase